MQFYIQFYVYLLQPLQSTIRGVVFFMSQVAFKSTEEKSLLSQMLKPHFACSKYALFNDTGR